MLIHWEKKLELGTGCLDDIKGEIFNCNLFDYSLPHADNTYWEPTVGQNTGVESGGCCFCPSGARRVGSEVGVWV